MDAFRRASTRSVSVLIPYFPYGWQDSMAKGREAIGARVVANLLENLGAGRVICVDILLLLFQALKTGRENTNQPQIARYLEALIRVEIANGNYQIAERLLCEGMKEAILTSEPFMMLYLLASAALLMAVRRNKENALEVYSLVHSWHFVSNSEWFSNVYMKPILSLTGAEEIISKERQPKEILWQKAESLLAEDKTA